MASQQVVVISGASSGIGLATAIKFAKQGWKVYAGVRTPAKAQNIATEAKKQNVAAQIETLELEVTKTESVERAIAHVLKQSGRIDVLVNNAGYGLVGPVERLTEEELRQQFETNVFGVVRLTQAVLPTLRAQKSGHILNVSSMLGLISRPNVSAYSSSKWALEAISQSLHVEVGPLGIKVSVIEPGFTSTPFGDSSKQGTRKVAEPHYDLTLAETAKGLEAGLKNGVDPSLIANLCWEATTDAKPHFRYQLPGEKAVAASVLQNPSSLNLGLWGGPAQ